MSYEKGMCKWCIAKLGFSQSSLVTVVHHKKLSSVIYFNAISLNWSQK